MAEGPGHGDVPYRLLLFSLKPLLAGAPKASSPGEGWLSRNQARPREKALGSWELTLMPSGKISSVPAPPLPHLEL